ncbi:MAG: GTP cyclohydrolase II [Methylococcaceae bacterium]|nr:GTP cyclohydrolase II [Methylococcaceae bacterium]
MKLSNPSRSDPANPESLVQNLVRTRLPTRHGEFVLYYYNNTLEKKEHLAMVKGNVDNASDVAVRLHSECLTGDVFGSLRCDCGDQLDRALRIIGQEACGVLLYLRQEGRGIGLLKKLQAYNLQDEGLDTVEANLRLGHLSDERDYSIAAAMLQDLHIRSVRLITNNPAKIDQLRKLGIEVSDRIPIEIPFNAENEGYLRTKARKMQHLLSLKVRQKPVGDLACMEGLVKRLEEHAQHETRRPFVTVAYARGLNGGGYPQSSLRCHGSPRLLRLLDAVLMHHDAALLTGRELAAGAAWPTAGTLVILDPDSRASADILRCANNQRIVLVAADPALTQLKMALGEAAGITVLAMPRPARGKPDYGAILETLSGCGIDSLLTGAEIGADLIAAGLADYGLVALIPQFGGDSLAELSQPSPVRFAEYHCHPLDHEMVIHGHF